MHQAGALYLEKLEDEAPADYAARVRRSNFFNGTWRTIAGLKGMAFRVDPITKLPSGIAPMAKDITLSGISLDALASNMVEEVLEVGRIGILVDHPPAPESDAPLTMHAVESRNLRPTIQFYPTESIINWKFARVDNSWMLVMVVLREKESIAEDEFSHKSEDRYRVLDLAAGKYRQRVFRVNDKGEDEQVGGDFFPLADGKPLGFIPFITVGATGRGDAIDEPPLMDLVDANIALYQVNSDRRHGLHFTGLPTPVISGYQRENENEKLYVGSRSAWIFPDPNANATYLEFEGKGLDSSKDMSLELKQEMAMLGARMLADESRIGSETLGGTQIKHQGENSMLGETVGHVSAAIEWALGVFAMWAKQTGEIMYQINRRFLPVPMGPQEITALVGAWQQGAISERDLFEKFQQGEVIESGKTFEEHQTQIDAGGPPRPVTKPANDGGIAA